MTKRTFTILSITTVLIISTLAFGFLSASICKKEVAQVLTENLAHQGNILSPPPIPSTVTFCGESVPLNLNWVVEGLDRELIITCNNHSRTLLTLKRTTRFFPTIEKIFEEEGVPADLKYLCIAESNLENVVSPAKAAGFWQFMEPTAKMYGLEVNDFIDERYHLEKSTRAACKYLKKLKNQFGSWSLAAAAYNMGENGLKKNMNNQNVNNYYDLYLNTETSRYVSRIIAYKVVFENQELYEIKMNATDYYKPIETKEIKVTETIEDLMLFAQQNKLLYRELKELNPWLRNSKLPVIAGKNYILYIPL